MDHLPEFKFVVVWLGRLSGLRDMDETNDRKCHCLKVFKDRLQWDTAQDNKINHTAIHIKL